MLGKYCGQLKQLYSPARNRTKHASQARLLSAKNRKKAEIRGRGAEIWVMCVYILCGYWPIARRLRTRAGEIDLLMRRGKTLIAIKVKYRADHLAETALPSHHQRRRVIRALHSIWPYYAQIGFQTIHLDIVVLGKWGKYRRFRLEPA